MRRPVVIAALSLTFGIVVAYLINLHIKSLLCCIIAVALLYAFWRKPFFTKTSEKAQYVNAHEINEKNHILLENGCYKLFTMIICFVLLGCGLMTYAKWENSMDPLKKHVDSEIKIEGTILSASQKEDHVVLEVDEKRGSSMLVSIYDSNNSSKYGFSNKEEAGKEKDNATNSTKTEIGDISSEYAQYSSLLSKYPEGCLLKGRVKVSKPLEKRNPGCFDYQLYLKTKNINYTASGNSSQMLVEKPKSRIATFYFKVWKIRFSFSQTMAKYMSQDDAGMLKAMLFGDKSNLDQDTYETFQKNGTAHILAVSGLHVGMVYGLFCAIIGGKRKLSTNVIILLLLVFYAALAGFTPSVVRASTMIVLHIISKLLHYRYDLMSAGAFSAGIMLMLNPYELFGLGFQLSYLAVFSMAAIIPLFHNMPDNTIGKRLFKSTLLPILAIQAGMGMYTAYSFNYFSVGAFLANIPVVFLAGITVPTGVIALAVTAVFSTFNYDLYSSISQVFAEILSICIKGIKVSNNIFYANGLTSVDTTSPWLLTVLLFYGLLFFFLSDMARIWIVRKYRGKIFLGVMVIVATSLIFYNGFGNDFHKAELVFVDVGQGDCLHIKTPKGKNIIMDGGGNANFSVGEKTLKPYLLKNGVAKVDLAMISHLDTDHYKGVAELAKEGMVEKLGLYEGNYLLEGKIKNETGLSSKKYLYMHSEEKFNVEKNVAIEILAPDEKRESQYKEEIDKDEENPRSLVVKISYKGISVLMTGDIDEEIEEQLVSKYAGTDKLKCDILKVGHHGSGYSSSDSFLDAVNPEVAVIQVGKNNYGHPTDKVLNKLNNRGIAIFRNDEMGAIGFYNLKNKGRLKVVKMIKKHN